MTRNFWIDVIIDGKTTTLSGGPRTKDGGMEITLKMRDQGDRKTILKINCYENDGELTAELIEKSPSEDSGKTNIWRTKR